MRLVISILIVLLGYVSGHSQVPEKYLRMAAENNPGLQAAYAEFEAALQKVPQANALPDPALSFGYFISPVETRVGPQRARLSLSQMFPWFGTLRAQADVAALEAEARYQEFLEKRNSLYYRVTDAWYPLFELGRWKEIEQENIDILQSYRSIALSRLESGEGDMTDVLRVDIMLNDALSSLSILKKKEKPLLTGFNKLLNRDESEEVELPDSLDTDYLPAGIEKDSMLNNNPALNAFDLKVEAREAGEEAARRQGLPKLGLGLDYVIVGERTDMSVADNGRDVLMPMLTFSIPIYRAKYKAAVMEAQLMQKSYSLQKEEYTNSLISDYEMAVYEIQRQKELIDLYREQIEESAQVLRLLISSYSNSGKEFEEVLRMQQQMLEYRKMKASAEAEYRTVLARLNYLTGKNY
ncbi:MAG: TolC family protein [Bacteroidales bacterium]|nr:TolC family protein [Bacteroidales bacterium]